MQRFLLLTVSIFLFLAACEVQAPPTGDESILGPITATGTVTLTGTSLVRRGTHMFLMDGRPRFFLESKIVNLSEYQDKLVVMQGDLFPNTSPKFLPVIVVTDVRVVEELQEVSKMQTYAIAPLAMNLAVPKEWTSFLAQNRLTFTLSPEEAPFIVIENVNLPTLPDGMSLRIDGQNGVRITEEGSDVHKIYVRRSGNRMTLFMYEPHGESSLRSRDAFYTLIRSVRFTDASTSSFSSSVQTGSGQPCGGIAGVVCPAGEYCAITELGTGIGTCRGL